MISENDPFVLWISKPAKLRAPAALMTAAPMKEVRDWRQRNGWADAIPLILFGGSELAPLGIVYAEEGRLGELTRVENAPPCVWEESEVAVAPGIYAKWSAWQREAPRDFETSLEVTSCMVERIALAIDGPVWEVCAGASGGLLAMAHARARGIGLALDRADPSLFSVALANKWGISISRRHSSSLDPAADAAVLRGEA